MLKTETNQKKSTINNKLTGGSGGGVDAEKTKASLAQSFLPRSQYSLSGSSCSIVVSLMKLLLNDSLSYIAQS